jgi:hypothetical protein
LHKQVLGSFISKGARHRQPSGAARTPWAVFVMPGLEPGIHVLRCNWPKKRRWPGRSPAMTKKLNLVRVPPLRLDVVLAHDLTPDAHLLGEERLEILAVGEQQRHLLGLPQTVRHSRLAQDLLH